MYYKKTFQILDRVFIALISLYLFLPNLVSAETNTTIKKKNDKVVPKNNQFENTQGSKQLKSLFRKHTFRIGKNVPNIVLESADQGKYLVVDRREGGILELSGGVHLRLEDRSIYAKVLTINLKNQEIFAPGTVWLREKDKWLKGQDLYYDRKRDAGVLYNISGYMTPYVFQGKKIRQITKELIILDSGSVTTCDLNCPHYKMQVRRIWVYGDRKIFAQHAFLYVGGIPIFYFPFYYQTNEGTGIISQFGNNERRGYYLQNTLNIPFLMPWTSDLVLNTKWMFDYYQRLGEFVGLQTRIEKAQSHFMLRLGYARHNVVDYDETTNSYKNLTQDGNLVVQNWYSIHSTLKTALFKDPWGEHSISYSLDWYNHSYMFPFFDHRYEPRDTGKMFEYLFTNETWSNPLYYLNWNFNYNRKGENSNLLVSFTKSWQWDQSKTFLDSEAYYLPLQEKLPTIRYNYDEDFLVEFLSLSRVFHVGVLFSGDHIRGYDLLGDRVHNYWQNDGSVALSTRINVLSSFIKVTPKIGYGYKKKIAYEESDEQAEEAKRNSYHYYVGELNTRIGFDQIFINGLYIYEKSFASEATVAPFYDDRQSKIKAQFFFSPWNDLIFKANTEYDFRTGFLRDSDRWSDLKLQADWTIDFIHWDNQKRRQIYKKYRLGFSQFHIKNNYNYIISYQLHGLNDLTVTYETGNFNFLFFDRIKMLAFGLRWLHDFNNSLRDRIYFTWKADFKFFKYWAIEMGGNSLIEQVYKYDQSYSFSQDLLNSINFYDSTKRNQSYFRLENIYIQVVHDLHCWELVLGWQMSQKIVPFGVYLNNRISYYEHAIYFSFRSRMTSNVNVQPTEIYRRKPDTEKYN